MPGILYVVSTPIGNLEDITNRAIRVLKEVDFVACEDKRIALKLLSHFKIRKHLIGYTEHKWYKKNTPHKSSQKLYITERLLKEKNVALISNAGTPLVSDPGYELVNDCLKKGIKVVPIPGVSAVITALSVSGLPSDRFIFEGFLPLKKSKRVKKLKEASKQSATLIFYESPYRVVKTLKEIREHFGNRQVVLARELTKLYEELLRGDIDTIISTLNNKLIKGEYIILIEGISRTK